MGVNIESARKFVEKAKESDENSWADRRRGVVEILLRDPRSGKVYDPEMAFSVDVTEDGEFDIESENPLTWHNTDHGRNIHQWRSINCFNRAWQGRGQQMVGWIREKLGALVPNIFEIHTPSSEEEPEEALGQPDEIEVPT